MQDYKLPDEVRIGHIHLKVSDIERSLAFYQGILGFELIAKYGDSAAFISAGGYHHHIALNTWNSKGMPKASKRGVGLFHTAILYPNRKELARAYKRLIENSWPLTGVADHGVSEALYLDDPDGNGVELYCDRPRAEWPRKEDGSPQLFMAEPLDIDDLLAELER